MDWFFESNVQKRAYDYHLILNFQQIDISRTNKRERICKEKQIKKMVQSIADSKEKL
jgi:hypothetical protein